MPETPVQSPVISFRNLRRLIGILGMALPAVCYLGGAVFYHLALQRSISFYYYTNVRDVLVGLLVGMGLFLISYNGYELIDSIVAKVTGFCGLGIAIFPCLFSPDASVPVGFFQLAPRVSNVVHMSCAAAFFLLLGIYSIFVFTLTRAGRNMTDQKRRRNFIYVACGLIILLGLAALVMVEAFLDPIFVQEKHLVFILETIMLEAFGVSWLVKGDTIFRDKPLASRRRSPSSPTRPAAPSPR